ncbi:MAG TPA: cyclopropane-fatty-acyl-phospholipid synthase family protein [Candidatus Angelobacter sp.]|nr:cyclopropane-fatty-acyl-phospholipid synthase family protein [Candidatus Angelobacter sp.]
MPLPWFNRVLLSAVRKAAGAAPVRLAMGVPRTDIATVPSGVPTIWIRDRSALIALVRNPQINFGDLYSDGRIEIEGDLVDVMERLYQVPPSFFANLYSRWLRVLDSNSLRGSRSNIHHHYDISNDFYKLWLDPEMVYTCAYFPEPTATLEEAQLAKMDLVCRKVWLRPGETVVEAGCGWGSLALHMARRYGVKVKAFNISTEQIAFARERAQREGLASRVEFIQDDYRNITSRADAFVSVGMLEHVGKSHYTDMARTIWRTVGEEGRGFLHFIGRNRPRAMNAWIRRRIFPGAYPPCLREVMEFLEPYDFSVLDVENLRRHYARTCECWLKAFESQFNTVAAQLSNRFARMWRLYLAGSTAAFRLGSLQLFQVVFAGKKCASQPWNRSYLYQPEVEGQEQECVRAMS